MNKVIANPNISLHCIHSCNPPSPFLLMHHLCVIYFSHFGELQPYYYILILPLRNMMYFNLRKSLLVYSFYFVLHTFVSHGKELLTEAEN